MSVKTIVVPTPASALKHWEGHPVPWVARWTGEVVRDAVKVSMVPATQALSLHYEDGRENREANGFLWMREGLSRKGKPEFAQVNVYRQKASMNKRLCQVCGKKIHDRVITWLISQDLLENHESGTLTASAPTCAACVPLAKSLCPHLKTNWMVLRVLEYEVWGVRADCVVWDRASEQPKIKEVKAVLVQYGKDYGPELNPTAVCAKQQVVRLTKYVIEEQA